MAVELDPQLLEILACPSDDHAPLSAGTPSDPDADMLTCTSCGRQFRVEDGIPVLLLEEAIDPNAEPDQATVRSASQSDGQTDGQADQQAAVDP